MTYSQAWLAAKAEFETLTGVSKPKESKGIFNAFGSYTGMSGTLKECDETRAAAENLNNTDQNIKNGAKLVDGYEASWKKFTKAAAGYSAVLEKAIDAEVMNRGPGQKAMYEKALKALKKQLAALDATIEANVAGQKQRFNKAERDLGAKERMLKIWETSMKGAVARGIAAAAKVKTDLAPATYNSIFPKAARDITMQLVFARDIENIRIDPKTLQDRLDIWGNPGTAGSLSSLPADATPGDVLSSLRAFIVELKQAKSLLENRR